MCVPFLLPRDGVGIVGSPLGSLHFSPRVEAWLSPLSLCPSTWHVLSSSKHLLNEWGWITRSPHSRMKKHSAFGWRVRPRESAPSFHSLRTKQKEFTGFSRKHLGKGILRSFQLPRNSSPCPAHSHQFDLGVKKPLFFPQLHRVLHWPFCPLAGERQ